MQIYAMPTEEPNEGVCKELVSEGLIEVAIHRSGRKFCVSSRGEKWLKMILETPLPVHEWVDTRRKA